MEKFLSACKGAYYGKAERAKLAELAVPDLDTIEHLWGKPDTSAAYRNILVGDPNQRGELWQSWLASGRIQIAEKEALYILQQDFHFGGKEYSRFALMGAVLINSKQVKIHEDVVPEGVERARQATEACEGDVAAVFMGCAEPLGQRLRDSLQELCHNKKPLLAYEENAQSKHQLWEISDPAQVKILTELFTGQNLYLLDGHHRLAAAKENLKRGLGDGRILACICSMTELDTMILPIHRIVYFEPWLLPDRIHSDFAALNCRWSDQAFLHPEAILPQLQKMSGQERACLVLHAHTNQFRKLNFPEKNLTVEQLELFMQKKFSQAKVIPVADVNMVLTQLAQDQAQVAFFLPPIPADQVQAIAGNDLKLPRKSTRFIPKPALGLLARPWGA